MLAARLMRHYPKDTRCTRPPFQPAYMGLKELEVYRAYGRPMTDGDRK